MEALALKVPSDGPRVDHTAISPWEVPNWVAHTRYMGVVAPYVRKAWTRDLMASCKGLSIMITHTAAAVVLRFAKRGPTWTRVMWMQPWMTQLRSSDTRYSNTRSPR
jgi:hypothetical protein